jgi:phosphoribosylglycinamide formyltransferase-1
VDEDVDHGPIIAQKALSIGPAESLASLEKRIHALEHTLYPQVLKLLAQKRVRLKGRKVEFV